MTTSARPGLPLAPSPIIFTKASAACASHASVEPSRRAARRMRSASASRRFMMAVPARGSMAPEKRTIPRSFQCLKLRALRWRSASSSADTAARRRLRAASPAPRAVFFEAPG